MPPRAGRSMRCGTVPVRSKGHSVIQARHSSTGTTYGGVVYDGNRRPQRPRSHPRCKCRLHNGADKHQHRINTPTTSRAGRARHGYRVCTHGFSVSECVCVCVCVCVFPLPFPPPATTFPPTAPPHAQSTPQNPHTHTHSSNKKPHASDKGPAEADATTATAGAG